MSSDNSSPIDTLAKAVFRFFEGVPSTDDEMLRKEFNSGSVPDKNMERLRELEQARLASENNEQKPVTS
ncbi:hypothetical protein ADEAN_000731400 [Angomonas deanei]|uniref:Uncharacterized protein n=1 Tax=Angomonas deanei TaxID=59799 RepID=A0A7G2CNJ8_9TRYP|nr:hypothetical protein ADEAN_000731400 [Angomonas deanei]